MHKKTAILIIVLLLSVSLISHLTNNFNIFSVKHDQPLKIIYVAVPGPNNISYLPIELIPKIGADQAEGIKLKLIHTGGGSVALSQLLNYNAEFAVAGLPAQMSLKSNNQQVVTVAAVNDKPSFVLMVRQELVGHIKAIADLDGHVIGVNSSSLISKTTSQQLLELLLSNAGVSLNAVNIIAAGQSWKEQSSLLLSAKVDAIMGDEPFASRLRRQGQVFFLFNLADDNVNKLIKGANFLHAALATRQDIINQQPQLVEKMILALKRALAWIDHHRPDELIEQLNISDADERNAFLEVLQNYKNLYSRDGHFSKSQLHETEIFFKQANGKNFDMKTQILDRWVGSGD